MMRPLVCLGLGVALVQSSFAQQLRDPMQMPLQAHANPSTTRATGASGDAQEHHESRSGDLVPRWEGPIAVMRIEGQPRLVVGTRLMSVGQTLGPERIERITETEVWLSQGSQQRRLALFEGIKRNAIPAVPPHTPPGAPQ